MTTAFSSSRSRKPRRFRRRGYTLIVFAMLLFALMALAALVIDLGLARMTQQQMQTAANGAALEGLRGRDRLDLPNAELSRRDAAHDLVAQMFDDDHDPAADLRPFGAGPRIGLSGGIAISPEFRASDLLTLPDPPVYDPQLRLNESNAQEGDMVAGDYNESAVSHNEEPDYSRPDFIPGGPTNDAFLVRLRRTNETFADEVGESGGTIPYLFGRGSLLNVDSRGRGIAVRATAISQARRTLAIGRRTPGSPATFAGSLPLFIDAAEIEDFVSGTALTVNGSAIEASGQTVGSVYDATTTDGLGLSWSLGDPAPDAVGGITASDIHAAAAQRTAGDPALRFGFLPVIGSVPGAADQHVIGFMAIEFTLDSMTASLIYTRLTDFVAPMNSSAVLAGPLVAPFGGPTPTAEVEELLAAQTAIPEELRLLTPALVR